MARSDNRYVCQSCGAVQPKWAGRCEGCGEWNTLAEEAAPTPVPKGLRAGAAQRLELRRAGRRGRGTGAALDRDRRARPGAGRRPGRGLGGADRRRSRDRQVDARAPGRRRARRGRRRGRLRQRRGIDRSDPPARRPARARRRRRSRSPPRPRCATSSRPSTTCARRSSLVIDSIQTMFVDNVEAAPGTVTQLRTSAHELIRFAKRRGTALFLIGHVTKDGQIAGPRVLEHMVDAVLYFEGDRGHQFRILRAVKNRFGAANEIGVFEMAERGLVEVAEPLGAVPRRARGGRLGRRGVRRHRGLAAAAGRDPGAGRAEPARHAAAHRGRLGRRPPRHAARGARGPLRACHRRPRRLSERRRRAPDRRAGGGPGGGRGAGVLAARSAGAGERGDLRRGRARRRGARGEPGRGALARGGETGLRPGHPAGRRRRAGALAAELPPEQLEARRRAGRCARGRRPATGAGERRSAAAIASD